MNISKDAFEAWQEVAERLDLLEAKCFPSVVGDPGRRVYGKGDSVVKVVIPRLERSSARRAQDLEGEHRIIARLTGIKGIPSALGFCQAPTFQSIRMSRVEGCSWNRTERSIWRDAVIAFRLTRILAECSWRGVAHGDLRMENILVGKEGRCFLIDFDQARVTSRARAILENFGIVKGETKVGLMKTLAEALMPQPIVNAARKVKTRWDRKRMRRLPQIPANASAKAKVLSDAWRLGQASDANAPGLGIAYYSMEVEGISFPGERPWQDRWEVLRDIAEFRGKRILELGCNMGLLSTFLLAEKEASAALAVDHDARILESAKMVAEAHGVAPHFKQVNFDRDARWERDLLSFSPDIVFALNVYNWLTEKERFLRFLSQFPTVIIEGHDPFEIEEERLTRHSGGVCRLLHISERARPLIICER